MPHILMVCTANICRSPVAEVILGDRLRQRGLNDWTISSAGTWARQARGASRHSVTVAGDLGLDITSHQAEMIELQHLRTADLVLCMEAGHAEALRAEFPPYAGKVYLLSEMVGKGYNISDPYGGPLSAYKMMAEDIRQIIDGGLDRIIELATK